MTADIDPRFEEAVRIEATTKFHDFLVRGKARAAGATLVKIRIVTARTLSDPVKAKIRESLLDVRANHRDIRTRVTFTVDPAVPRGREVRCDAVDASREELAEPPPEFDDDRSELLVLSWGALRFEFVLSASPKWLPFGRPHARHDYGPGVVLPRSMLAVPSGRLLDFRFHNGELELRRYPHGPHVAVTVDDQLLIVERGPHVVGRRGRITFTDVTTGHGCSLDYELQDWLVGQPSVPGEPDHLDGSPHPVVHESGRLLLIEPPRTTNKPEERLFPVPSSSPERPMRHLVTHVLYSEASERGRPENRWHVKMYRCATPQHAAQLRRYLRTQAVLIEQVNASVGGTAQAPPWVIAPVHVLSGRTGVTGPQQPTDLSIPEQEVVSDPENRLSAWFGVADRPQPACFVLVVSPLLTPVGWPMADMRASAPGVEQLPELYTLAVGLDAMHKRDIAHCDIKPANVCRYLTADNRSGYVLIDGDSVARATAQLPELRFSAAYASPEVLYQRHRMRAPGRERPEIDLREHDRFGFALVVLTALAGEDRVTPMLTQDDDGRRTVDSPDVVAGALAAYWPEHWRPFAVELAAPLRPNALGGDDWSATRWIDRLRSLVPARPSSSDSPPPEVVLPPAGRHARHVDEIRAEARSELVGHKGRVAAVAGAVRRHQLSVARHAYWREIAVRGLLPMAVPLILLAGLLMGR
ncbi:hypothetical protein FXN61_44060 [Lentzea sp. PSKA42]|uniref:Protein kinase domain-containing protein n=1 Tax=Lentzea indica TaxID=2604800 RepID=A0ABX1FWN7_9PSEU|nr:hypothetical protein [Lentzea indica]NKE63330.1 hypothetical protein [Lentzea indica]